MSYLALFQKVFQERKQERKKERTVTFPNVEHYREDHGSASNVSFVSLAQDFSYFSFANM